MHRQGTVDRYRSARSDPALALLEGFHPLKHALRFGAEVLEALSPDPDEVLALAGELAPDVAGRIDALLEPVPEELFGELVPRPPGSAVVALARRPEVEPPDALEDPSPAPVVLLERPTHLGNLGAAVRVAAAAGAAGVLATGPHDPWHASAIRGSAGLHWALPVAAVEGIPESGRPLVAVDPEGEAPGGRPLPERAILVFGSERRGLEPATLERADRRIRIPMRPGVSSLNLATAVAAVLYGWLNAGR
jgi:TrmH family RNA methyltransferase